MNNYNSEWNQNPQQQQFYNNKNEDDFEEGDGQDLSPFVHH